MSSFHPNRRFIRESSQRWRLFTYPASAYHPLPPWLEVLTIGTNVIRLNVDALDLATLDHNSVTLATVGTEEGGSRELNVQGTGEGTAGVGQEADTAALLSIKRLAPGGGAGSGNVKSVMFLYIGVMAG